MYSTRIPIQHSEVLGQGNPLALTQLGLGAHWIIFF